jgi:carbonic anhydrase
VRYLTFAIFSLGLTLATACEAQQLSASMVPGAKLYVAPMEWNLDRFVVAQIVRQGLPVQLVTSEDQADFVMMSFYQKLGSHLIATGHYIQVQIVATDNRKPVWADEVNDFALVFGRLRHHGPDKAAESIVKKLRNSLTRAH